MRTNRYKHPRLGIGGKLVESIVNSETLARLRRTVLLHLPFLKLSSDVKDVVYLTWLVPVHLCEDFVPRGVKLWQRNGLTPFTVLSYQHTHFGPSFLGPIRRLFPSPLQSNWRLYLDRVPEGVKPVRTVLFLKNIISSLPYLMATRIFSDALPTHLPAKFVHCRNDDLVRTEIIPGWGSSPALSAVVRCTQNESLDTQFASLFGSWAAAVEFLVHQEAAIARVENADSLAFAEIRLPIDMSQVLPVEPIGEQPMCSILPALKPVSGPFCFLVKSVPFQALSERLIEKS